MHFLKLFTKLEVDVAKKYTFQYQLLLLKISNIKYVKKAPK